MNLFTFITFCAFLSSAAPQYYYVSQPVYHIPPPTTYNAFSPFSTYHVNPHFQQFRTVPAPQPNYHQFRAVTPPPAAPVHRPAFTQNDDMDYRGFAYHTRTDNGATSHVLFVTGPQAQQVNSRVFNNFNSHAFGENNEVKARTVASEMIDPVQKTEEKQNVLPKNIQDLYSSPGMQKVENNDPYQVFQSFFRDTQGPAARLVNFYSRNTDLFAQPAPGYPANVVPLPYNVDAIRPRILQDQADNKNNTESDVNENKNVEVAAESIITNTRFRLNDIQFENEKSQSTSTPTTVISLSSTTLETLSTSSPAPSTQRAFQNIFQEKDSETSSISTSESTTTNEEVTEFTTGGPALTTSEARSLQEDSFLLQRFGSQPDTRADSSDSSKEMPGSESSESSTSDISTVKSMKPASNLLINELSTQGLNILMPSKSKNVQTSQDLISGNMEINPVSSETVTENVSMSGNLTNIMSGVERSSVPMTSSSLSSTLPSAIITTEETLITDTTIITSSEATTDMSTNEQMELTTIRATFESDVDGDSTTNSLIEEAEEEEFKTESTTDENTNENISTTENILITTDAMMTTTSQ